MGRGRGHTGLYPFLALHTSTGVFHWLNPSSNRRWESLGRVVSPPSTTGQRMDLRTVKWGTQLTPSWWIQRSHYNGSEPKGSCFKCQGPGQCLLCSLTLPQAWVPPLWLASQCCLKVVHAFWVWMTNWLPLDAKVWLLSNDSPVLQALQMGTSFKKFHLLSFWQYRHPLSCYA